MELEEPSQNESTCTSLASFQDDDISETYVHVFNACYIPSVWGTMDHHTLWSEWVNITFDVDRQPLCHQDSLLVTLNNLNYSIDTQIPTSSIIQSVEWNSPYHTFSEYVHCSLLQRDIWDKSQLLCKPICYELLLSWSWGPRVFNNLHFPHGRKISVFLVHFLCQSMWCIGWAHSIFSSRVRFVVEGDSVKVMKMDILVILWE